MSTSSHSPSDRRRQWLISRGLLSPSGPSRRLHGLLPSARRTRSAEVDVRLESRTTPVLIARTSADRPSAPRAVSMPSVDDHPLPSSSDSIYRTASSRAAEYRDRPTSPPRRRFRMRRGRKQRGRDEFGGGTKSRSKITVVDRQMPRSVMGGMSVGFDGAEWDEYRGKIDRLAQDESFMTYLTEPVERRDDDESETGRMAVNKLYPLAFIRLLEAHARYANERNEVVNPEDELHRYDDLDGEDEDRIVRTASSGMYDMGRFRTVGSVGNTRRSVVPDAHRGRRSVDMVRLIEDPTDRAGPEGRRMQYPTFRSRMSRESRVSSVPVC